MHEVMPRPLNIQLVQLMDINFRTTISFASFIKKKNIGETLILFVRLLFLPFILSFVFPFVLKAKSVVLHRFTREEDAEVRIFKFCVLNQSTYRKLEARDNIS